MKPATQARCPRTDGKMCDLIGQQCPGIGGRREKKKKEMTFFTSLSSADGQG